MWSVGSKVLNCCIERSASCSRSLNMSLIGLHRVTRLPAHEGLFSLLSTYSCPCLFERAPHLVRNMRRTANAQAQGFGQKSGLPSLQDEEGLSRLSKVNSSESGMGVESGAFGHLCRLACRGKTHAIHLLFNIHRNTIGAKRCIPCSLRKVQVSQVAGGLAACEWLGLWCLKAQGLLVAADGLGQVGGMVACRQVAVGIAQVVLGCSIVKRSSSERPR